MSHWSDFFACSSRVTIWKPGFSITVTLLSAVSRVRLPSFLIPTIISDSQYLNNSLLEVVIVAINERVFILDLSNLTLQIIFNAWWAPRNVGSKQSVVWNDSRHSPLERFYLHCGIEETGSPGIACIMCDQVLRHPTAYGTSWMGKHLMAKALVRMLNRWTEQEVTVMTCSTVDETA